jgi:hypothetical protein
MDKLDNIIKRNEELLSEMEQSLLGDVAALIKIQEELRLNNKELLEQIDNMRRVVQ